MKSNLFNKSTLFLSVFLAIVAVGVGVSAYSEPIDQFTRFNTAEPIDVSSSDQVKIGGLSVNAFSARGNANFKKDLSIKQVAMGCNGGVCDATAKNTTVSVGNDLLATGDMKALIGLKAKSLEHSDASPRPVCANDYGIIVFCPGPTVPPPPTDLCDNIAGVQATVGGSSDLSIDDPAQPKFCTQTIRGTITLGQWNIVQRNLAGNAELADLAVTNITIKSVGGVATSAWPSPTPLKFRWSYCGAWNPKYYDPNNPVDRLNPPPGPGNGAIFSDVQNGTDNAGLTNGYCQYLYTGYPFSSTPLYGYSGRTFDLYKQTAPYVAYDGVTTVPPPSGSPALKGIFDAGQYEKTGAKDTIPKAYSTNLWYKKGHGGDPAYANIIRPGVAKIILDDVKVPAGYKLDIVPSTSMPGTLIDIHYAP